KTSFQLVTCHLSLVTSSRAFVIKLRLRRLAVVRQSALRADGVGALENPVLPGREPAVNLGVERLGAGEAQGRFHPGERVGGERGTFLDGDADFVLPVEVVGSEGDEARRLGPLRVEAPA